MDLSLRSVQSNAPQLLLDEIGSVFHELGLVGYNSVTGTLTDDSPKWRDSDRIYPLSISYTLPVLLAGDQIQTPPWLQLKIQPLANFLVVWGSVARDGSGLRNLCFDKTGAFASGRDASEFRRSVKDELCFPLLLDIVEAAGLPGPNCFSTLPGELKLGILVLLPAAALARMECVCSALRSLCSSNDLLLWRVKVSEEFWTVPVAAEARWSPRGPPAAAAVSWKKRFVTRMAEKRRNARMRSIINLVPTTRELLGLNDL